MNPYIVPPEKWGKDHWSTLAYAETKMVEGEFRVALDPRMRTKRRTFRVMGGFSQSPRQLAVAMDPDHGSRLADGSVLPGHDDWDCLQDMWAAGYVAADPSFDLGAKLTLTESGVALAHALRAHKMAGGSFENFKLAVAATTA